MLSDLLGGSGANAGGAGGMLRDQVVNETEEQRRKRLQGLQQNAQIGPVSALYGVTRGLGAMSSALGGIGGR